MPSGTLIFPTGEIPFMRKITALLGFYGLNPAGIIRLQHDACSVRSIDKRKAAAVALQVAEFINERHFIHAQISRNRRYVFISQADVTFPAAAGATPLAGMAESGRIRGVAHHISQGFLAAAVICGGRT